MLFHFLADKDEKKNSLFFNNSCVVLVASLYLQPK